MISDPPAIAPTMTPLTETERELHGYLEALTGLPASLGAAPRTDRRYRTYEALVLDRGRRFAAQALPPFVRRGQMKLCFHNTLTLIRDLRTLSCLHLTYCEGYAIPEVDGDTFIPVQHAWAVDSLGRVWDRTWPEPEASAYYGIPFAWEEVERFDALGPDYLGILGSEYLLGAPLLHTGQLFPTDWQPTWRRRRD